LDDENVQLERLTRGRRKRMADREAGRSGPVEMPHPRFNASLPCRATPYTLLEHIERDEKGDQEFTSDEMWAVDLKQTRRRKGNYRRELEDGTL